MCTIFDVIVQRFGSIFLLNRGVIKCYSNLVCQYLKILNYNVTIFINSFLYYIQRIEDRNEKDTDALY